MCATHVWDTNTYDTGVRVIHVIAQWRRVTAGAHVTVVCASVLASSCRPALCKLTHLRCEMYAAIVFSIVTLVGQRPSILQFPTI